MCVVWSCCDDDDDDIVGMIFFVSLLLVLLPCCRCCASCYRCYMRSNNYCVVTILRVILFQTSQFVYPRIYQSSRVTKPHPTTRLFLLPPAIEDLKKCGFYTKTHAIYRLFCTFFARSKVKYEPISKWFSFSDSTRQALQHCRAKFVATQTSLHENNYRNFFRGQSVCVR